MMNLHIVSESKAQIDEIADLLLSEGYLCNAIQNGAVDVKSKSENGTIVVKKQYALQGISKSLLFSKIEQFLKKKYPNTPPLVYSEPVILIASEHQERILNALAKV